MRRRSSSPRSLILGLRAGRGRARHGEPPRLREGIAALRPRRALAAAVVIFGVAMTITTGCWIAGVPTLIRDSLHHGAGGFSVVMIGFAVGAIAVGAVLARMPVRHKARASMLAWLDLPARVRPARAGGSLPLAVAAAVCTGRRPRASPTSCSTRRLRRRCPTRCSDGCWA